MFHPKRSRFRIFLMSIAFAFTLLCLVGILFLNGIRYYPGGGRDYPSGIYQLMAKDSDYAHGNLVLFCPPNNFVMRLGLLRGYTSAGICDGGFMPEIRKIMALQGDYVTLDHEISINGHSLSQAAVKNEDAHHYALPHIHEFQLHESEYFMMLYDDSNDWFDSRYYGPVPSENIIGLIHPIWTW
ncbi:conjugative transfer signal peptidase TraF [Vibrio parahaemolyticus]|uniref:conjugative transfer signal peptidase TraF n=1 Tax=Vibrio parahaemolyticus TaxID=670 RepID=UPI001EE9E8A2|nr:conjugative transfer signal peptidase TraF [Vibrio parahaemolyticus]MCG6461793.1 conjugative transfer signal peptidase TraF [Vibrio parahaemolyticus]